MRHVSDEGLTLIKHHEGLCLKKYRDVAGYWTIGYGHLIKRGERFPPSGITKDHAEALLSKDLHTAERAVACLIKVPLHDLQFDALVSFTFNLGGGTLQRSTLRRKVNGGYHDEVPEEFAKWIYAAGRQWQGLINRRADEADLYDLGTRLATANMLMGTPIPISKLLGLA